MKNFTRLLFALFVIVSIIRCDSVTDCIINTRPYLPHKDLDTGQDGQYYEDVIRSEIKNEPRDREYWVITPYRIYRQEWTMSL